MKLSIGIAILAALTAAAVSVLIHHYLHKDVAWFYGEKLRGSLFSGFLTLGGFLLSLKTFIIVKMKEGLYDSKLYRERYARAQKTGHREKLYTPLVRLKGLLLFSISSAISTATAQLTIGLYRHIVTATIAMSMAAFTVTLLLLSLIEINGNLNVWFDTLDPTKSNQDPLPSADGPEPK